MPHFLASERLMRSHVRGVGKWDPIKGTPPLSTLGSPSKKTQKPKEPRETREPYAIKSKRGTKEEEV